MPQINHTTKGHIQPFYHCHCRPARGKTESQKLFQFCTDPNQIWHARHLGPWATAQQIWEESDDFECLASRELGQGAGEDALAGKRPTGAPAPAYIY